MSCTILPLFSTTVSPSSPHPIWPSFSYPLFFLSVSHPFLLLGGSSMRGLPGLEVYFPWSIVVAPCSLKFTLQSIWNTWPNWSYSDWALLLTYSMQCYFASSLLMPQFGPYLFSLFIFCHILKPPFPQTPYFHHPDWTPALCSNPLCTFLLFSQCPSSFCSSFLLYSTTKIPALRSVPSVWHIKVTLRVTQSICSSAALPSAVPVMPCPKLFIHVCWCWDFSDPWIPVTTD